MKLIFPLRTSRSFLILLSIVIYLILFCDYSNSQTALKIFGQVIDSNGPVSEVVVNVENTVFLATTGRDGYYYIYDIPAGEYRLSCWFDNVTVSTADKITVGSGPPVRRDIFLENNIVNTAPVYSDAVSPAAIDHQGFNVKTYNIGSKHVESIESLLKDIPGINVVSSPATGEVYISTSGIRPDGVNILIDGRKINSLLTGRADLNQIPIKAVAKIEYFSPGVTNTANSGGLGGTINFVTVNAVQSNSYAVSVQKGSYGEEGYNTDIEYQKTGFGRIKAIWEKNFLKNNYQYTDYYGDTQTRENAVAKNNKYYFSYSNSIADYYLNLSGYIYNGENGVPGPIIGLPVDASSQKETISVGGDFSRHFSKAVDVKVSLSTLKRDTRYKDFNSFIQYDTKYLESESRIALHSNYNVVKRLNISSQLSYTTSVLEGIDNIRPAQALGKISRNDFRLYGSAGYNHHISVFSIQAGSSHSLNRVDNKNFSASNFSASFVYTQGITAGLTASFARSFRLPGLAELHWQEDVFVMPNPDLKPETSNSISTEIFSAFSLAGKWRLSLEYRDIRYNDLIYWRRSQGIKYKPVNVSASDFYSAAASVSYKIPGEIIEIDFSRVNSTAINKEKNQPYYRKYITFQPLYINTLSIKINYRNIHVSADMLDSSQRYFTEENTKQLDPYTLVNAGAGVCCKLKSVIANFDFKVKNLTNIEYELLEYQPMPPRSYHFCLTLKLS